MVKKITSLTDEQIKVFLNDNWDNMTQKEIAKELHVGIKRIIKCADELGIRKPIDRIVFHQVVSFSLKDYIEV